MVGIRKRVAVATVVALAVIAVAASAAFIAGSPADDTPHLRAGDSQQATVRIDQICAFGSTEAFGKQWRGRITDPSFALGQSYDGLVTITKVHPGDANARSTYDGRFETTDHKRIELFGQEPPATWAT